MPDDKLISLEGMKVLAQQTKSYVDGAIAAAGSATTDIQQGNTVKTFSNDFKTVITEYSNGNRLEKHFSNDMKMITSILRDSEGKLIATEIKTISDDGLTIDTKVYK